MKKIIGQNDDSSNRDKPLAFHWKALDQAWLEPLDLSPATSKGQEQARASILLEAYILGSEEPGRWVSYSRRRAFYANQQRYNGTAYTYANVVSAIDSLASIGLLENRIPPPGLHGIQSTFRATMELMGIIDEPPTVEFKRLDSIRLKDDDKQLIDFAETRATTRIRKRTDRINDALESIDLDLVTPRAVRSQYAIHCGGVAFYPAKKTQYRVFSRGSFNKHGRFYGGDWLKLKTKKEDGYGYDDRNCLTIDGEVVLEVDFPCLHISMLYAMTGRLLVDDAYTIPGWPRKLCKTALNTIINAKTKKAAERAVAEDIVELARKQKISGKGAYKKARKLIAALKEYHAPIAQYFSSDIGVTLMYHDSRIAERVLLELIDQGTIALPVHDSFIAKSSEKDALLSAMGTALEQFLEDINFGALSSDTSMTSGRMVPHMVLGGGSPVRLRFPAGCLDLFRSVFSVSFCDIQGWRGGIAPDGVQKAIRHELKRRNLMPEALADMVGISRPQLVNILQGRFGASPGIAKALRAFIIEGAETIGLAA